jgi:hypothetical protein
LFGGASFRDAGRVCDGARGICAAEKSLRQQTSDVRHISEMATMHEIGYKIVGGDDDQSGRVRGTNMIFAIVGRAIAILEAYMWLFRPNTYASLTRLRFGFR